jgi:multidrug efflux pump
MSKFFIHRPVFAWVLAIIMMIAGGLAILQLPIAQYPTIAPPAVAISATYPVRMPRPCRIRSLRLSSRI